MSLLLKLALAYLGMYPGGIKGQQMQQRIGIVRQTTNGRLKPSGRKRIMGG